MTQLIYMATNPLSLYLIKPKNVYLYKMWHQPLISLLVVNQSLLMNKGRLTFLKAYVCRTVSDDDVEVILDLKRAFEKPFAEVREQLQSIDIGCPHVHHAKLRGLDEGLESTEITKAGRPLPCASGMCGSKLRILRAASVHYPALRQLLHAVYVARKHHSNVAEIDNALLTNDYKTLCNFMCIEDCEDLIGETLKSENSDGPTEFSAEGLVNIENDVQVKYAQVLNSIKKS